MTCHVYLLKSEKTGRYYIGQTENIVSRLQRHNLGRVNATKTGRPWTLVKYESYKTRSEARWREYQLKGNAWLRKQFYGP